MANEKMRKPYGDLGTYEAFVADMNECGNWDSGFEYQGKEYWIVHEDIGTRRHPKFGIRVYYTDIGVPWAIKNRQSEETSQVFEGDDIRPVIENYVMHDGRPFKDILKEPGSFQWL